MITVGMNYEVLPGKEKVFEDAFDAVLNVMREDPGHESSALYRNVHDPGSYVILSVWNSDEAFEGFVRSEKFAKVTNWGKETILRSRPSHTVYRR
jgi:heme-degrading monooxygenase HmoA